MYIKNSSFLQPLYKKIRPYECSMVAIEGANTVGKISLQGLEIDYDSYFVSKMILSSGSTNKPIMYGFLGNDITYALIKVIYDNGSTIRCSPTEIKEKYIEYYFADEPNILRPISQLMILTGGSNHRLPQMFLNNPLDIDVEVEIMVASANPVANTEMTNINYSVIDGLYYNSIITDRLVDGCTQFCIVNELGQIVLVIPLTEDLIDSNIQNVKQTDNVLTISTDNEQEIILKFLSVYDAKQAHSRMNWIFKNPNNRYLTVDYPAPDVDAPVLSLNLYADGIFNSSGITKELLKIYYIDSVVDVRDGTMDMNNVNVLIRKKNSIVTIEKIVEEGIYDIIFRVKDIAGNETQMLKTAIFDMTAPVITFTSGATTNNINVSVHDNSRLVDTLGLTNDDLLRYCIFSVKDNIDGIIANSAVTIDLTGITYPISKAGSYPISFSVIDYCGNENYISGKTLIVTDDIPSILNDGIIITNPNLNITGNIVSGYTLLFDANSATTYNLQFLDGISKDKDLISAMTFYVLDADTPNQSLIDYYNWNYADGDIKTYLLGVASSENPLFYIAASGNSEYMHDGFNYSQNILTDLQLRGDYPIGEYIISGDIIDINGNINNIVFTITITN